MSELKSLVYVSSATRELSYNEVDHLLKHARERNKQRRITGVLMYIAGTFMQHLEGEAEQLALTYDIIKADPLHTGLIQLLYHSINSRDFEEWTMAYCTKEETLLVGSHNDKIILNDMLGLYSYEETSARILLQNFWKKNAL
jgi:hypothetical protein